MKHIFGDNKICEGPGKEEAVCSAIYWCTCFAVSVIQHR